jgi:hypothetical protein
MSGKSGPLTSIGRSSTDQATRARKWLSSGLCSFFAGVGVPIPAFLSHHHYSTGRKFSDKVRTSQLVYDATRNAVLIVCTPRVGQSTVCESRHSDILPSCHLHSSQKTRRRWSNCGDDYPKWKSFQVIASEFDRETEKKLVFRNGDAP